MFLKRTLLSSTLGLAFVLAPLSTPALQAAAPERSVAERALLAGRIDEAMSQAKSTLATNSNNGEAHLLLCRAYYAEDLASEAAGECDAALSTLAGNSVAQDWAGRAFGMQAGHAGPFTGMRLARRVKAAFSAALSLDPRSRAAVSDLAEYLIAAPGIVGGSLDDARSLADRIEATMPEQAHRIRALLAQKAKDDAGTEREYRAAASTNSPAAWVDLAQFYVTHHQPDRAVESVRSALAADKNHGPALLDAASILTSLHREPALAVATLRSYLASGAQSDESPAFKAHVLLGQILAGSGDKAGAHAEFITALGMASNYAPAKKALAAL